MESEISETILELVKTLDGVVPQISKIYKKFFDCLVKEGFTQEQAMELVISLKLNK